MKNYEYLESELKRILEVIELKDDHSLVDLDSLSRTEIIILFEEASGVQISDAAVRSFKTLGDLQTYLVVGEKNWMGLPENKNG